MSMKFQKQGEGQYFLDVLGYVCPHPQIYIKKALEKLAEGDILDAVFDNPSSAESIAAMCEASGNEIVEKTKEGANFRWKIKKA